MAIFQNFEEYPCEIVALKLASIAMDDPVVEPEFIDMPQEQLQSYVGSYKFDNGDTREITLKDGMLYAQRSGQDDFAVYPYESDSFSYNDLMRKLIFKRDGSGEITSVYVEAFEGFCGRSPEAFRHNKTG